MRRNASCGDWNSTRLRLIRIAVALPHLMSVQFSPFTARCTLLADIMAQSPTMLDEWRQTVYWATLGTELWPRIIQRVDEFVTQDYLRYDWWLSKHRRQSKICPYIFGGLSPPNPWYPPPMTLNVTWCGSWRGPTLQPNSLLAAETEWIYVLV